MAAERRHDKQWATHPLPQVVGDKMGSHGSGKEHLVMCKQSALAYLDAGDLRLAWLSMTADMRKHPGTDAAATSMLLGDEGQRCVQEGSLHGGGHE